MKRFKRQFLKQQFRSAAKDEDRRPYYDAHLMFQAADQDEADRLFEAMTEALGCGDCHDNPCPHFRIGSWSQIEDDE